MKRVSFIIALLLAFVAGWNGNDPTITRELIAGAETIIGLRFSHTQRDSMMQDLLEQRASYENLRRHTLPNSAFPSLLFDPIPRGWKRPEGPSEFRMTEAKAVDLPRDPDDLAFYSVKELGWLIRNKKITSLRLTEFYLDRLKRYGPKLECVITITEERALQEAKRADAEIAAGNYRGPLHGIPYGIKDLFSTRQYRTTWGARPYENQMIDEDAAVIRKLEEAGAVLIAKLSLGALAWGDVWFGGFTRNPWDYSQGSSGSSAGSASATAAGLVAFSIGTETWGSIVSPATRCGVSGLRPTYGRVSRSGAMALAWSMDKVGPICRTVEDCAIVFQAIHGPDGLDPSVFDFPFQYDDRKDWRKLRIAYLRSEFELDTTNREMNARTFDWIRRQGVELIPLELPKLPFSDLAFMLSAEAAAAFDDLTRSCRDTLMVRQVRNAWPNVFRAARFIPAVEYIQASRLRRDLVDEWNRTLEGVDVYLAPSFSDNLLLTNLTGHPCVVMPQGTDSTGRPAVTISLVGRLFGEADLLLVAKRLQESYGLSGRRPTLRM